MESLFTTLITASLVLLSTTSNAQDNSTSSVWVTVKETAVVPYLENGKLMSAEPKMQQLIEEFSIISVEQALPASKQETLQKVYEFTCDCNVDALTQAMNRSEILQGAERAPEYELLSSTNPDDYTLNFNQDYALDLIHAEDAWGYTTGDTNTILGVSDGSFLGYHEDLANKYVSMTNSSGIPMYYYYHGTAVATAVAGRTNNGIGKSAIGYDCKLALNTMGYNQLLQLAYGGSRVINASWSSGCWYSAYYQMVIDEINDLGAIVVAAAGNGSTCGGADHFVYPASLDGVISVTSVGPQDNHERTIGDPNTTHQHNSKVDICAPGYDVALTVAPGWYLTGNGTSFAAPYVSGTIGLMLSMRPCLTYDEVLYILQETSADVYAVNYSDYYGLLGAGRLDAGAAIEYVANMIPCEELPTTPTTVGSGVGILSLNNGVAPMQPFESGELSYADAEQAVRHAATTEDVQLAPFEAMAYPNPTNQSTFVQWNQEIEAEMQVIDATGAIIQNETISHTRLSKEIELEQKGMYLVRLVKDGQLLWSEKVVKL
ncbi:MAG: S8 family serine peptidase [bacterium]|nr:S8 family serine peptidase [bacterium]